MRHDFSNIAEQCNLADLRFPAAAIAAAAKVTLRVHGHVAKLARKAGSAADDLPVAYDAAAQTRAGTDIQEFIEVLRSRC